MQVHRSLDNIPPIPNPVLTIGTYDGVHKGHQEIIHRIKELAQELHGESVIITFYPHPRVVLHPEENNLRLINTLDEKITLLEQHGVDHLVVVPFTEAFASQSPQHYVEDFLVQHFHPSMIVIGYNHKFGHNREGDLTFLKAMGKEHDFAVEEIPQQVMENLSISSTKIRNAILGGDIPSANSLLGNPFFINGMVVKGDNIGHSIGFPTANIQLEDPMKILPANGVYAVKVQYDAKRFNGMLNIGFRPTVNGPEKHLRIEVNIFDFEQDLYGKWLRIEFFDAIRQEKKFTNLEELRVQLLQDRQTSLDLLN